MCHQFESGKQYRTINSLRSAIFMTHMEVNGSRIGQHPLVTRFLKEVYNSQPPAPKYSVTWDVDIILSYISALPDNVNVDVKLLSNKVVMLLALANADGCSDLATLDLNFRTYQTNGAQFMIPDLTKSRGSGPPIEAFYSRFTEDPKLCSVLALSVHEEKTESCMRSSSSQNPLFISIRKSFKPWLP